MDTTDMQFKDSAENTDNDGVSDIEVFDGYSQPILIIDTNEIINLE